MKTKCCERCGKEIGFFDFKHELKNDRMDWHYDSLCSQCHRILSEGINSLDNMYDYMIKTLRERYHSENMAAVDLDTLIFLAVEAVFSLSPDYSKRNSKINRALINCNERNSGPDEDLIKIIEYLIDYGFSVNKKNVQVHDFRTYFKKTTLFAEQVGMNSKEDIPKVYYYLFLSCKGLVAAHMETGESFSIPVSEGEEHVCQLISKTEIHVSSLSYPDHSDRELILYTLNEDQTKAIIGIFNRFNDVSRRRKERRRRDTMSLITKGIYKDLKKIKPGEDFAAIPVDSLLIFIVKNIISDVEGKKDNIFSENSLLMDILFENFYENLVQFGRISRPDVLDYLIKNTLLSKDFFIQYDKKRDKGWAFFTTRGYILGFIESRKFVYVFEDRFPNDIYYPCNDLVYKGYRYLQLAENKKDGGGSGNYRNFDGFIFFSEDVEKIGEINRFFNLNNIFYVMDLYIEAESKIFSNRETALEVKRVSDKLFAEFSFLPFCQYDEWAAILEKLKEDDFLLCQLIDKKTHEKKYSPAASTSYTIRMIKAFNRCAQELANTLHFDDLSVAKAILWGYFNESLIDTLSREWIRIAGDIVRRGDSLVDAFSKYFNMAEIECDKSYYLGLYIYYLMSKGVLPEDDFLENYERCIPIYCNYNRQIEMPQATRDDQERQRILQHEVFNAVKTGDVRPLEDKADILPSESAVRPTETEMPEKERAADDLEEAAVAANQTKDMAIGEDKTGDVRPTENKADIMPLEDAAQQETEVSEKESVADDLEEAAVTEKQTEDILFTEVEKDEDLPLEDEEDIIPLEDAVQGATEMSEKESTADDIEEAISAETQTKEIEEETTAVDQENPEEDMDWTESGQTADTTKENPSKNLDLTEKLQTETEIQISVNADEDEAEKLNPEVEEVREEPEVSESEADESERISPDILNSSMTDEDEDEDLMKPVAGQISMLSAFMENELKNPSEILAEKAAKAEKNGQPVRRIIENED